MPGTLQALERARWITMRELRVPTERGESRAETWVAFPARTYHKALFNTLEDNARMKLHGAIAQVIADENGTFGKVEAAWHAAQSGETTRAAQMLLEGARATAEAHFEASSAQLVAFARRVDPSCEAEALDVLESAVQRASAPPPPANYRPPGGVGAAAAEMATEQASPERAVFSAPFPSTEHASIPVPRSASMRPPGAPSQNPAARIAAIASVPPTAAHTRNRGAATGRDPAHRTRAGGPDAGGAGRRRPRRRLDDRARAHRPATPTRPASEPPTMHDPPHPRVSAGGDAVVAAFEPIRRGLAARLGELAKEALLADDNAALERWVDGLRASGESPAFADRLGAMARLGRGDIGDALRVLRHTKARLDPHDHRRAGVQTSLALGVRAPSRGPSRRGAARGPRRARARPPDERRPRRKGVPRVPGEAVPIDLARRGRRCASATASA